MRASEDVRGAVFVEHLIVFMPLFILFLGVIQLGLIYAADMVVKHSANTAARAAIVVIDDDPAYYGGAPRGSVVNGVGGTSVGGVVSGAISGALSTDPERDLLSRLGMGSVSIGGLGGGLGGALGGLPGMGNARYRAIRDAASIPLLGMSPSMEDLVEDRSVYTAIGGSQEERALVGASLYNKFALAVTFPGSTGNFGGDDEVTVRVTYLYRCSIPLVSRIACRSFAELAGSSIGAGAADRLLSGLGGDRSGATRSLMGGASGLGDLAFAEAPWLGFATLSSGARFTVIQAEATLPLQSADYLYVSEGGG